MKRGLIYIFPILTITVILVFILAFLIKRSNVRQQEETDSFWSREKQSKLTPAVDLETVAYLNVPIEKFHFGTIEKPEVQDIENEILSISKKPLLNLSGKTNTELREIYGAPNLEAMQAIGDDFDKLTMLLVSYSEALINENYLTEAITVLEYGVFIKTDISKNYTLLADCFSKLNQPRRIKMLEDQVKPLHLLMEPVILEHFEKLLSETSDDNEDFSL